MKISKDIDIIDLALYTSNHLIFSDFHIGYEEALNKQGVYMPRFQFKEIIQRLEGIFRKLKGKNIDTIILNGDVKHEFGTISDQEWRHTLQLIDFLGKKCEEIVLLKGNHDKILGPIAKKRNVRVEDHYIIDKKTLVIHGDKIPDKNLLKNIKTIIIGHEHPAVSVADGPRVEVFKCYLKGKYERKDLIIQPSFNLVTEGTDVIKEKLLSPLLQKNLNNFDVFIVADKVYEFGKLKGLK